MTSTTQREELDSVVIRFAGDSGDGMQLTGQQFSTATALMGNDLSTFPDFPAEIRAPTGTLYGVSGFQVHFSCPDILTPTLPGTDAAVNLEGFVSVTPMRADLTAHDLLADLAARLA